MLELTINEIRCEDFILKFHEELLLPIKLVGNNYIISKPLWKLYVITNNFDEIVSLVETYIIELWKYYVKEDNDLIFSEIGIRTSLMKDIYEDRRIQE